MRGHDGPRLSHTTTCNGVLAGAGPVGPRAHTVSGLGKREKTRNWTLQSVLHFATVELVQNAARGESTHGCHTPFSKHVKMYFSGDAGALGADGERSATDVAAGRGGSGRAFPVRTLHLLVLEI